MQHAATTTHCHCSLAMTMTKTPPLPVTIDDVSPSDVRRNNPLSLEELRDIRSLIGAAKRKDGGDDVVGASASRLAGRRVMVPATSRAFFEGVLSPPIKGDGVAGDPMRERIVVNDGRGNLAEMTRGDAAGFFDGRERATKKEGGGDSLEPALIKKPTAKTSTKNAPAAVEPLQGDVTALAAGDGPALPLMEIREECDMGGNILNSELVNMSNTMKRLGDGLKSGCGDADGGKDDGRELGELLARTLKEGEADIITKDAHKTVSISDEEDHHTTSQAESNATGQKRAISDEEYSAIYSRLEELERLEEEDARNKRSNAKSSKKLQSGGWSTGFLNKPTKKNGACANKTQKKANATVKTKQRPVSTGSSTNSTSSTPRSKSTFPMSNPSLDIKSSNKDIASDKTSRVSFSDDDKIKEIPRIGQLKVPPRPTANPSLGQRIPEGYNNDLVTSAIMKTNGAGDGMNPSSASTSIPFEENVFRGVVKERGLDRDGLQKQSGAAAATVGGNKKLSRFAQQRLEREGRL